MTVPRYFPEVLAIDRAPGVCGLAGRESAEARETLFVSLVERQSRFVFRVAYAVLRNVHDAEDVVQETFLKLYQRRAWESIEDERAFLARAAWRTAVDRRPRRKYEEVDSEMATGSRSPEECAIGADMDATVGRLIDALSEELRQPLVLSGIEGLNSREIARVMGIAEGTVRTRLKRAREMVKRKLQEVMRGGS